AVFARTADALCPVKRHLPSSTACGRGRFPCGWSRIVGPIPTIGLEGRPFVAAASCRDNHRPGSFWTVTGALPTAARVVVIGGGVGGVSVAYHLAELGEPDVLIVERDELTSGSTFHSAGLVGQLRADPTLTRMNMYSVELYRRLQQGDNPVGWTETGGIRVASS